MPKFNLDDTVTITGRVTEVVSNEAIGTKYTIKVKANDKLVYLNVEEDEIAAVV